MWTVSKTPLLNGWNFFALVTLATSVTCTISLLTANTSVLQESIELVRLSVRLATPWLYLAFAAAPIYLLFPGPSSKWLMRNRRFIGLSFAVGMAWQLVFIAVVLVQHPEYSEANIFTLDSIAGRAPGYLFLTAMTLTSFRFGRRHLSQKQWKMLHKSGGYVLWFSLCATYIAASVTTPSPVYVTYAALGIAVLALRILASRRQKVRPDNLIAGAQV